MSRVDGWSRAHPQLSWASLRAHLLVSPHLLSNCQCALHHAKPSPPTHSSRSSGSGPSGRALRTQSALACQPLHACATDDLDPLAGARAQLGQSRRDPRAAMGQPPPPQQQQVPSPALPAPAGDGRLPEGDTAALAAQLAAGGDSALRLQQILANLPMVRTHSMVRPNQQLLQAYADLDMLVVHIVLPVLAFLVQCTRCMQDLSCLPM